ncbi:hypothetical protein KUL17_14610 [Alteromonas sp. KUL17]|uniref:hypothetical protein n=1 Tax=Alteromonas sp. KUL17 TaxID=2480796 RepID=UPI0010381E26|nr:hypothetical protein [Alteromonas sp. KUL17]TAP29195.1 hypothetical protein KUL49_07240 [Alteromonas sp. KUL17]GEA02564.1 hypothetical protein KUL17_14610 [Alteromonas sp. KUL17]
MKKAFFSLVILSALFSSGCAQRVADFTLASTKNIDINKGDFVKGPRVKGEDSKPVIIFPLGIPNVKEAADKAIESDKCAVGLTDVTADSVVFSFLIGYIAYEVEGDLVIDKNISGCENWQG